MNAMWSRDIVRPAAAGLYGPSLSESVMMCILRASAWLGIPSGIYAQDRHRVLE